MYDVLESRTAAGQRPPLDRSGPVEPALSWRAGRRSTHRKVRRQLERAGLPPGLELADHPRSGRNDLVVVAGPGHRWLAKSSPVGNESWFYRHIGPQVSWVPAHIPVEDRSLVIVEYLDQLPTLFELARDDRASGLEGLVSLGGPLAELHSMSSSGAPLGSPALPGLDPIPLEIWADGSEASSHVLRSIHRRDLLGRAIDACRAGIGPTGLIHGDLKTDNVLRGPDGPIIIDWELAGQGALCWDLGCVVGSMVAIWLDGIDLTATGPASWLEAGDPPFAELHDAVRRFLGQYLAGLHGQPPDCAGVAGYAASWLIVRAWAEATRRRHIDPRLLLRLVIAEGLIRNPRAIIPAVLP